MYMWQEQTDCARNYSDLINELFPYAEEELAFIG